MRTMAVSSRPISTPSGSTPMARSSRTFIDAHTAPAAVPSATTPTRLAACVVP